MLILLDRDGTLNEMVVDPGHGTIDSPLHPSQVVVSEEVISSLAALTKAGHGLAICTNQPSAAKGKTTMENLIATHERVLELCQSNGGRILSSHICFHRKEDSCLCRKPQTGLLEAAMKQHARLAARGCWMVGDGVTDVEAGTRLGLKTAFLGPRKCDACKVFDKNGMAPTFWGESFGGFVKYILKENS